MELEKDLATKELELEMKVKLALALQEIKHQADLFFRLEHDQLVERQMGLRSFSPGEAMIPAFNQFASTHLFEQGRSGPPTFMPEARERHGQGDRIAC